MSRLQYQIVAQPIDLLVNPPSATTLDVWEPHAEIPRRRPRGIAWQRATYTSGYADPSYFLTAPSVVDTTWLVQNATPRQIHTRRKFHASLYPSQHPYIFINTRSIQPFGILSTATVGTPSLIHAAADAELFIAGTRREWRESTMRIDRSLGARSTASFTLYSTSGYRPSTFDEVVLYQNGIRRFGGLVQNVTDELIVSTSSTELQVQCVDYMAYLDRVVVAKLYTQPIGALIWIILFNLVEDYLAQFGVTYSFEGDPLVVLPDTLFHYITAAEVVNRLISQAPGWNVWIDENKQLHLKQGTAGTAAAFSLTDTNRKYSSLKVSIAAGPYANKWWVLPSANLLSLRVETFTGDSSTQGFFTDYVLSSATPPLVKVDGVVKRVTAIGAWTVPYDWYFIPDGQGVFQKSTDTPLTALQTLTVSYPNPWPLAFSAQDDAQIALHGLYESVYQAKDVETAEQAQALADGLVANSSLAGPQETVDYQTNSEIDANWLSPGMTQTSSTTRPLTSGSYVVERVLSEELDLTLWKHTIRLRKGGTRTDGQVVLEAIQAAGRLSRDRLIETATFALGETISGLSNPGLTTGAVPARYIVKKDGVLSYWSLLAETDPPTGVDLIVDAFFNGVTMFPAGVRSGGGGYVVGDTGTFVSNGASTYTVLAVNGTQVVSVSVSAASGFVMGLNEATLASSGFGVGLTLDAIGRPTLPAGQTTEQRGYLFSSDNLAVSAGDVITLYVTQVGSINPGKDITGGFVILAK